MSRPTRRLPEENDMSENAIADALDIISEGGDPHGVTQRVRERLEAEMPAGHRTPKEQANDERWPKNSATPEEPKKKGRLGRRLKEE